MRAYDIDCGAGADPRAVSYCGPLPLMDAIVWSNGWDDDTVALQLLSPLDRDALNVTLLVPEAKRATRIRLVSALNDHYGSPG